MSSEAESPVTVNDQNSSLTLSQLHLELIARGRRDLNLLFEDCPVWEFPLWLLRHRAGAGDADAQNELGDRYRKGSGLGLDAVQAAKWYEEAAKQKHLFALCSLGEMHQTGEGVSLDLSEALRHFRVATEDDVVAEGWDPDLVSEMWSYAAALGDAKAQYLHAGNCWSIATTLGIVEKYTEAVEYFRKAAEQDYALAQFNLSFAYSIGKGVQQDHSEAVKWLRRAAENGLAAAQNNLGEMYSNGEGVEQDYAAAALWYRRAAETGLPGAYYNLGLMYERGEGFKQNHVEAAHCYETASNLGLRIAQFRLGLMYEGGKGVVRDRKIARKLCEQAAAAGEAEAQTYLQFLPV